MKIGYKTDVGKKRELDEDSIMIMRSCAAYGPDKREAAFLVVADGMGGHKAGEIASRLAAGGVAGSMIGLMLKRKRADAIERINSFIQETIQNINRDIFNFVEKNPQYKGMGTTLTGVLVMGLKVHVGHVGDSRAYIVNKKEINQITKDHSFVQEMVDRGEITQEQARTHPQKNIITRAIGVHPDIEADTVEEYIWGDDFLLLCCDGLTDMLTDEEIHTVFKRHDNPQTICDTLVKKANDKGGLDNISVIVAQFNESPNRKDAERLGISMYQESEKIRSVRR